MRLALPLAAFALFAVPAAAQTASPAPAAQTQTQSQGAHHARHTRLSLQQRFQMANTLHDGHLTQDQAHAASVMHTVSENFAAIDKDHKGYVTEDDIRAWYKARRAESRHHAKDTPAKS
jgi:uncharacterized membrane-anchored protein